jgi:hypothetical protein
MYKLTTFINRKFLKKSNIISNKLFLEKALSFLYKKKPIISKYKFNKFLYNSYINIYITKGFKVV